MMKKIIIWVLLTVTLFANTEAILKLDTKGHTSTIRDIIVTKSGDIISASDDKTIRVWDSVMEKEKQQVLITTRDDNSGRVYAIALSKNEDFLAVGGYLIGNKKEKYAIRIYNYRTGKLLKILISHKNVILDLAFSSDGKYLISGSADYTAKIWRVRDWTLKNTIRFHTKEVYAVKIIKKEEKYFAVTTGADNQIALYDIQTQRIVRKDKKEYKLNSIAISKNHIAVCGGKEIQIYNYNLEPIKTINSETKPLGLAYSPNGKYLIVGTATSPRNVNIYNIKDWSLFSSFKKHTNLTMAVGFLNNQTAISAGGNNNEIYIWDIKTAQILKKIEGGKPVWSVGVVGNKIAWGNKWTDSKGKSKFQKFINLKTFKIGSVKKSTFKRISTTYQGYSLNHRRGGVYGLVDGVLDIKKDGKIIASITKDVTTGLRHNCYGFYKNYIVSGGLNGQLKIYNFQGKEIANLVGHTGDVFSIAIDGDRLVSGSSDRTICIWNLSKLSAEMTPQLNLFIANDNSWVVWTNEGYFNKSDKKIDYLKYYVDKGDDKELLELPVDRFYETFYRPDLVYRALMGKDLTSISKTMNMGKLLDEDGLAPTIELLTQEQSVKADSIELKFKLTDNGGGVGKVNIYRDGVLISQKTKSVMGVKQHHRVGLREGENSLKIVAFNANNNVESDAVFLEVKAKTSYYNTKPKLFVLSVGIQEFKRKSLQLNYAVADAKKVAETLETYAKDLFDEVKVYPLTTKAETSRSSIENTFKMLAKKVRSMDYFLVNFSSHGETVYEDSINSTYYLLTSDVRFMDKANLEKTALSADDLTELMALISSDHKILVLDTCYAGAGGKQIKFKGGGNERNMKLLQRAIGNSVFASSGEREKSMEGIEGHGLFTYFFVKGLEGEADDNNDNNVSISELKSYTENKVADEAEKRAFEQFPYIRVNSSDFPITIQK